MGEEIQVTVADGVLLRSAATLFVCVTHKVPCSVRSGLVLLSAALLGLVTGFALARPVTIRQRALAVASKSHPT